MKTLRFDTTIAVCALLLSAIAAAASVYQTRVIADQYSATVWPYVTFVTTFSPAEFRLTVQNNGLGPALVRSADLEMDGKRVAGWGPVVRRLTGIGDASIRGTFASFGAGDVIRPAQEAVLMDFRDPRVKRDTLIKNQARIAISVCYCSLLERCWRIRFPSNGAPADSPPCGPNGAIINA